ncbi:sigma-70 family RNA polymerase sigma factor [Azospirillum agricola]|uniref:sigma-70 family RNA polymerase sigma factor n=1 Tax=Azospirillum agricola TaxID=1720247 RepID=UPI000A0EFA1F|nr:sigma-70 family RNA polymerase sigma factor [Azospirillum agricola]SMH36543.1 RNA polymerase sigma-70 factor, ECF subfamily [Azospirillum lipoferum]
MDISRHLGLLRRYALVLTRDRERADDLVQETALRALEGSHGFQEGRDVKGWLLAIVHNAHVSRCRRRRTESEAEALLAAQAGDAHAPDQTDRIALNETMRAMMALPEDQRAVLTLVAIDGMSYRDAADCLGIPLGTLMSRLGRARAALRAAGQTPASHLRLVR